MCIRDRNNRGGGDLRSDNPLVGSWAGDNIVIAGDYADEGKFVPKKNHKQNLYGYSEENYKDISFDVIRVLCEDSWWKQNFYEEWKRNNHNDWSEERQTLKVELFGENGSKMKKEEYA